MFNAYMQEINKKKLYNFQFILHTFLFPAPGPKFAQETAVLGFVELCLGVVASETLSYYTRTNIILPQHFINNFSLHTTHISHLTF
jgi:hypothetical protein